MNDRTARDCVQRRKPWIYVRCLYINTRHAYPFCMCAHIYLHVYSVRIYAINIKVPYKTQSSAALLGRRTEASDTPLLHLKCKFVRVAWTTAARIILITPLQSPVRPFCSLLRRALESSARLLVLAFDIFQGGKSRFRWIRARQTLSISDEVGSRADLQQYCREIIYSGKV